jgi:hypothetical protein
MNDNRLMNGHEFMISECGRQEDKIGSLDGQFHYRLGSWRRWSILRSAFHSNDKICHRGTERSNRQETISTEVDHWNIEKRFLGECCIKPGIHYTILIDLTLQKAETSK